MTINDVAIYLTDNGRALCGRHLGATSRATGRDISGQPIHRLTDADQRYARQAFGAAIPCEQCAIDGGQAAIERLRAGGPLPVVESAPRRRMARRG